MACHLLSRWHVRSLSRRLVVLFASPLGVFVLAALDSSLFFSLPFGIDAVVIIVAARRPDAWIVPFLAAAGSSAGAALTFWMGVKIGEKGLERYVSANRLETIRRRIKERGAIALASLSLIPPPFPFTPFVLAAGALEVRTATFFTAFAVCRLIRFGVEAVLAVKYGRRILQWLDSRFFQDVVAICIAVAIVLTILSVVKLIRSTKPASRATV
jgi:membrane protein YqaA with SNARE-associated domain